MFESKHFNLLFLEALLIEVYNQSIWVSQNPQKPCHVLCITTQHTNENIDQSLGLFVIKILS